MTRPQPGFLRISVHTSAIVFGLTILSPLISGCAGIDDTLAKAHANPAQYQLYDCKQLESERKDLAKRIDELDRLIAKARTGAAGPLVVEMVYRDDELTLRGQAKYAEEEWVRNKCNETTRLNPSGPKVAAPSDPKRPIR